MINWADNLIDIINNFINTYDGKPDKLFWNSMINNVKETKVNYASGMLYIMAGYNDYFEGWLRHFFL